MERWDRLRRGAIYSFDALIASIAVISIVYLGISVLSLFSDRAELMASQNEKDAKLLLFADYLVKDGLAVSDGARIWQHRMDAGKAGGLDAEELAGEFGVERVGFSLVVGDSKVIETGGGGDCVRRIVWVPEYERVGFLDACIG